MRPRPIVASAATLRGWQAARDRVQAATPEAPRPWYRVDASGSGPATIDIYDEIGPWGITSAGFVAELRQLAGRPLDVRLNSPGGEVFDGIAIYNALLNHTAHTAITVDGLAASMASLIFQAGDTRTVAKASQVMIHLPMTGVYGNRNDMRESMDLLDQVGGMMAQVYADRAGGQAAGWLAVMDGGDKWYSADGAVEAGLADAVQGADTSAASDVRVCARACCATAEPAPAEPAEPPFDFAEAFRAAMKEASNA